MKRFRRFICILLSLVLLRTGALTVRAAHPFQDVAAEKWYAPYVDYVYGNGLMNGTSETAFAPNANMSRAMVVTVLHRLEGSPASSAQLPFSDVAEGKYYTGALGWSYEYGIVNGTSETLFSPNDDITRQQLVAIFYRYAQFRGMDTSARADLSGYTDRGSISAFAADAFGWAVAAGIINGTSDTLLSPRGTATRAQCAAMLQRLIEGGNPPSQPEKPTEPTLEITTPTKTRIYIGERLQIEYEYSGDKSELTWKTSNPSALTIDNTGIVTGVQAASVAVRVSNGDIWDTITIIVADKATETTEIRMNGFNAPLSDGINKFAGDYMNFKAWTIPEDGNPEVKVTSSNSSVVSVSCSLDSANDNHIKLNFKSAGSATITITSEDGNASVSYTIHVKPDYDCNPGDGLLDPETWAECATQVMVENGFKKNTSCGSYRVLTLGAGDLTWSRAKSIGESCVHDWWIDGCRSCWISYEGRDERGNYIFYTRWG